MAEKNPFEIDFEEYIRNTALDYDFEQERNFNYKNLSIEEIVRHITFFVSRLWQIHAFGEGNTRTTAVFTIKYLRSLGFYVNNDIFAENSWYFRNALVRANYNNLQKGIHENHEFLEKFFRNLLMGEHNELKNRYCHIRSTEQVAINPEKSNDKVAIKRKNSDIIIDYLKQNDSIDNQKAREITGLSSAGVRKIFTKLESDGLIAGFGENKGRYYKIKKD